MPNSPQSIVKHQVYRLIRWQFVGIVLLTLLTTLFLSLKASLSFLVGGMDYAFCNFLFAWAVFRFAGAKEMTKFVIAFFFGEMGKLFLSAILFLVIVKTWPVSLLSALAGLFGAIVVFWVVSFWQFSRPKKWEGAAS